MSAIAFDGAISLPNNGLTFEVGERVYMSGSYVAKAGDTTNEVGTVHAKCLAGDSYVSVWPKLKPVYQIAGGAFSAYATLYGAASGRVDDIANANLQGLALEAASGAGSRIAMLPMVAGDAMDNLGAIDGNVVVDDDFVGDWPAAATALSGQGPYAWTKTETNGLGVISSNQVNGVLKFSFDAVAEAATAALYMSNLPFDIDSAPVFECRVAVYDIGDDAALDINIGMASGTHATDFDQVGEYAAFHLNGNALDLYVHSDDGSTDTAEVDTTVNLVDDTFINLKIDFTDKSDVKFFVDSGSGYAQVGSGTTYDMSNYSGALTPIVHVEKTSNDTTADVRVDRIRVQCPRG